MSKKNQQKSRRRVAGKLPAPRRYLAPTALAAFFAATASAAFLGVAENRGVALAGRAALAGEIGTPNARVVPPPPRNLLYLSAKDREREGKFAEAKSIYRMAIHNGVTGVALREAYLGLARCEEQEENFWEAFKAIESSFPTREELIEMPVAARGEEIMRRLETQMRLADALAPRGAAIVAEMAGKPLSGWHAAAEIYYAIVYNNPHSEMARQALIKRGDVLRLARDFAEAEKSYRLLINTFPDAPEVTEARISLAGLLAEKTAREGGLRGDAEREAVDIFRSAATQPNLAPPVQEKLATAQKEVNENKAQALLAKVKDYYLARGNRRERDAARWTLNDIITRYPETAAATEAREMLEKLR